MRTANRAWGIAILAAVAAGCAKRAPIGVPPVRTLTVSVRADVSDFFPSAGLLNEGWTLDVNGHVFEGLSRFDRHLVPRPALAQSWRSPDDLTWVFTLHEKALFADGTPVTAEDVVASIGTFVAGRFPSTSDLAGNVERVTALSAREVEIKTRVPMPLLAVGLTTAFITKKAALEGSAPAVGAGPYRVERWTKGKEIVLAANPWYHAGPPPFPKVVLAVEPDGAARVNAVLSGTAQLAEHVPFSEMGGLAALGSVRLVVEPSVRVLFLGFRVDRPPFSDPRVRHAVQLAIDRDELNRRVLAGRAFPATQVITPAVAGFNPDIALPPTDRAAARRLLEEAGHKRGLAVTLEGTNDRYVADAEILKEAARQLGEAGFAVTAKAESKSTLFPRLEAGEVPFFLMGWNSPTLSARGALLDLFRSPSPGSNRKANRFRLADPELDALTDGSERAANLTTRSAIYAKALARVAALDVVVPLVVLPETYLVSNDLLWERSQNLRLDEIRPKP